MRKLTNIHNLPLIIEKACLLDTHRSAGDISCSQLIDSPRIRLLKKTNDYTEDVSEMLYALMGTALHHILERANISEVRRRAFMLTYETIVDAAAKESDATKQTNLLKGAEWIKKLIPTLLGDIATEYVFEVTLQMDIDGTVLYGTFDIYHKPSKTLYDYKFCSVYQWMYPESQRKWKAQTNIYATLLENAGYPVEKIIIVPFFRDWSESKMLTSKDYPKRQIMEIPVELGSPEKRINYIKAQIDKHKKAEESGVLPLCTGTERWASADMWAIKTITSKKALRVVDSQDKVKTFMDENQHKFKNLHTEYRPGESRRCAHFCPVSEFCDQYAEEKKLKLKLATEE